MSTVNAAWRDAAAALAAASESAALDAQLLLAHVLGADRTALFAHPERELSPAEAARYAALVAECRAGTPLPYVLGTRAFYRHDFLVTPDVLIPRPETEHLVEAALAWAQQHAPTGAGLTVADAGTGSGAIAVSLALALPEATTHATEISAAALAVARHNAQRLGAAVHFHHGDLLAPLPGTTRIDLLAANLPYIPSGALSALRVTRHEPRLALDGGADGLSLVRRLLAQAAAVLQAECCVLLEIGADQGSAAAQLCRAALPGAQVDILQDYAGYDRIIRAVRGAPANQDQ